MKRLLSVTLALGLASPAAAELQPATCGTKPATADPAFIGWDRPAATSKTIGPGVAFRIPLKAGVRFAESGKRDVKPDTFGGSTRLTIAQAGDYAIALSQGAWLDVVSGGKLQESVAHRHGPPCSTMRKIVTFRLLPGTYAVQVSGSPRPDVVLEVVRSN